MCKQRQSKDMLRKKEQRKFEEKRELDSEIAKDNIREDNGEELPWDGNDSKEEKLETLRAKLEAELEEIHRELRDPGSG